MYYSETNSKRPSINSRCSPSPSYPEVYKVQIKEKTINTSSLTNEFISQHTKTTESSRTTTEHSELVQPNLCEVIRDYKKSSFAHQEEYTHSNSNYVHQEALRLEQKSSSYSGQEEHESYRSNVSLSSESSSNQNSTASELGHRCALLTSVLGLYLIFTLIRLGFIPDFYINSTRGYT